MVVMPTRMVAAESLIWPCEIRKPSPCLPTTSSAPTSAIQPLLKAMRRPVKIVGAATGRTTRASVVAEPAPSVRAARTRIGSTWLTASWVLMMQAGKAAMKTIAACVVVEAPNQSTAIGTHANGGM